MKSTIVTWVLLVGNIVALLPVVHAESAKSQSIHDVFFPYQDGVPQQPGIRPGLTIDQHNWQVAEPVLPAEILQLIQAGDFRITVQETTDLPSRAPYIKATVAHASGVSLNGWAGLQQYQGGRPFPVLDPSDPQAGKKAIWNFRYRDLPQTLEVGATVRGVNSSGTIDRTNVGRMRLRYGMYRVGEETNDPQWQERGVFMKASFRLLEPADQEGMMRIMTVYDDDTQPQEVLSYNPKNRRTRKSHSNLLARLGGGRYDVLMEEQPPLFFIGYLHEYDWTYQGERVLLLPGFLQADQVTFGGKNKWYPNVPWELRRVIVLEATPRTTHPYSKRVFYLDTQTYALLAVLSYGSPEQFVRLTLNVHGHPEFVPGAQGIRLPIPLAVAWINVEQADASQFIASVPRFNGPDAPQWYGLMELLRKGK